MVGLLETRVDVIVGVANMTLSELIGRIKSGQYDHLVNSCGGGVRYDYSNAHFGNPPEAIHDNYNNGAYFGNPAPYDDGPTCG